MVAGDSAGAESRRQLALAEAHEQAAAEARAAAGRFGIAEVTEKRTARTLAPLSGLGYFLLPDRCWPGTKRAQVDLIVIGPGGVFIVDTKAWAEVAIHRDRVFRGDADVTDELMSLADLADVTQADLTEVGLAPGEVRPIVVLAGRSGIDASLSGVHIIGERDVLRCIASHGSRLTPSQVDAVLARALHLFPQVAAPAPIVATVPEPILPLTSGEVGQDALLSPEEVNDALLQGVLAQPIEEWMSFLHPQQAKLVRRSFPGPSRVRGPAGTGKTVVGLHRAAHLARIKPGRILVTTYVRTLPEVLRELLRRLAPEAVDRVDFTGTHAFARRVLQERGVRFKLDPAKSKEAFDVAWRKVGTKSVLGNGTKDHDYWADEIEKLQRLKSLGVLRSDDSDQFVVPETLRGMVARGIVAAVAMVDAFVGSDSTLALDAHSSDHFGAVSVPATVCARLAGRRARSAQRDPQSRSGVRRAAFAKLPSVVSRTRLFAIASCASSASSDPSCTPPRRHSLARSAAST
jgi:hypothetical protein